MTAEAPSISPVVDDGDLKDVLRALVGEINRLNSRVDSLSSDNRLLRFELIRINQQLNRASPRDQMERRAALYSELALTPHSDDAAPTDAPAGGTHEERMAALEQRLNNLETHTAEPSGREDGALVFAKCFHAKNLVLRRGRLHLTLRFFMGAPSFRGEARALLALMRHLKVASD